MSKVPPPCPVLKALLVKSSSIDDLSSAVTCILLSLVGTAKLPKKIQVTDTNIVVNLSLHPTNLTAVSEFCGDGITADSIESLYCSGSKKDQAMLYYLNQKPMFLSQGASNTTETERMLQKVFHTSLALFRQYELKKEKVNSQTKLAAVVPVQRLDLDKSGKFVCYMMCHVNYVVHLNNNTTHLYYIF